MGVARTYGACAYADERGVTASAEYRRTLGEAELIGRLLRETAYNFRAGNYLSEVFGIYIDKFADRLAPSLVALSRVIEELSEG